MKKRFVLVSIVMCCVCAIQAQEHSLWSTSVQTKAVVQPMARTSSSQLISMQGHERIEQAFASRLVTKRFESPLQDDASGNSNGRIIHRVGPNKPNEPGVPVGDALPMLLMLAALYALRIAQKRTQIIPRR